MMTTLKVEQQAVARRAEEQRVSELLRYTDQSQRLTHAARNEAKLSQLQTTSLEAQAAAEQLAKEKAQEEEKERRRVLLEKEENDRIANKVSREKNEKERKEREIQRICETSEELKELERSIQIAYVNKERAAQHQEALLVKEIDEAQEYAIEEKMEQERQSSMETEARKEEERRQSLLRQKAKLQKQILDRQELSQLEKEELLKEKEIIDSIMSKLNVENRREIEEQQKKKEETRALAEQFRRERERSEAFCAKQELEEEQKIKEYNEMTNRRIREEEERKKAADEMRYRRWQKVVEETSHQTKTREEYIAIRNLLWEEEFEAKRAKEEKDRVERQMQQREEVLRLNQAQIEARKEMAAKMEEEESQLVQLMREKFAADEEEENRRQQNRQREKTKFISESLRQREERARMFEQERYKELADHTSGAEQEEFRKAVISEARKRLLAQHAEQLQGFLPKGALRDNAELTIVSRGSKACYKEVD